MVAEGLPLVLTHVLPTGAPWIPFLISTTAVALFGEIMPQAIMPLYVLEVGGRTMWFMKSIMWILAIPACLPAYALRKFRNWREKDKPAKSDGILEEDEMVEFVRLHEKGARHGGPLTDECGSMVRAILSRQHQRIIEVEDVRSIRHLLLSDVDEPISLSALTAIRNGNDAYLLVVSNKGVNLDKEGETEPGEKEIGQEAEHMFGLGAVLCSMVFIYSLVITYVKSWSLTNTQDKFHTDIKQETIGLTDLPLRDVPYVQTNCYTYRLLSLLNRTGHP